MFDQARADRAINFIKQLRHTKGKFKSVPFAMLPWQEQATREIFGTVREDGNRQYNTAYIELPKKMGKSEYAAAIALYLLCADNEHFAEVYGAAADRGQASIIFDVAMDMVDQNPTLKQKIKPIPSTKRLVYHNTKSYYQVLSAEAYSKHGYNVHGVVFDEIHAQPDRRLFDVLTEGSGDAREQPLFFLLTTAGDDADRNSIGWEVHQMAVDVLTGVKDDPTFYGMIYGVDRDNNRIWKGREYETIDANLEDADEWRKIWTDEEVWEKVNPSLGHTVAWDKVRDQFNRAQGNLTKEKNFRWLRLNSWEKATTSKWLGLDFWDRCNKRVDEDKLEGRPCYGGLDLSTTTDMTAFVLLFPPDDINPEWQVVPRFWIPEENLQERVNTDKVPYDEWRQRGLLITTPGNAIDYRFIEQEIIDLNYKYRIVDLGYDPWKAVQTSMRLEEEGMNVNEVRQIYKTMSPAMFKIEEIVRGKKLRHGGHPILRWNVNNVEVKQDENENIRPVKKKNTGRIDGLVATITAMDRAMRHEDNTSVYESRGVRVL